MTKPPLCFQRVGWCTEGEVMADTDKLIKQLYDALEAAEAQLDYCGYGDSWEREGAMASKLPEQIETALEAGKDYLT